MIEMIGSVAGFHLSASPVINGTTTVSASNGTVIRSDGQVIHYSAASCTLSWIKAGVVKRVCMIDPLLGEFPAGYTPREPRSLVVFCDDQEAAPGAYQGGLIVLGHVELTLWHPEAVGQMPHAVSSSDTSPATTQNDAPPAPYQNTRDWWAEHQLAELKKSGTRAVDITADLLLQRLAPLVGQGNCFSAADPQRKWIEYTNEDGEKKKWNSSAIREWLHRRRYGPRKSGASEG